MKIIVPAILDLLAAAFLLAILGEIASGQTCNTRTRICSPSHVQHSAYVAPHVEAVIATQFVPIPVPVVGVAYQGADPRVALLEAELNLWRANFAISSRQQGQQVQQLPAQLPQQQALPGQQQNAPIVPKESAPPLKEQAPQAGSKRERFERLVVARCANCHDASTAKDKGEGIELTSGRAKLTQWSAALTVLVIEQVQLDKMPKSGSKLTDAEVSLTIEGSAEMFRELRTARKGKE